MYQNMELYDSTMSDRNFRVKSGPDEWKIRIFCHKRILFDRIDEISEEAAFLEELIMASPPGKAYLLQRKKTFLVRSEIERICDEFVSSSFSKFKNYCYRVSLNSLDSDCDSVRNGTMIFNASFFVGQEKLAEFLDVAEAVKKDDHSQCFYIETEKS
jgi:hypothetical protein